jgi:transposase
MLEPDIVNAIRRLKALGHGTRNIGKLLELDRKTVRRWLDGPVERKQVREGARRLKGPDEALARELFEGVAEGNAVVVVDELRTRGVEVSARTVQRVVAPARQALAAATVATLRFESGPGEQMQVDFGQKRVVIDGVPVVVHLMAAVLGYSRRLFVKAFLVERSEDWRDGILSAWRHFGGVTRVLLVDNSRCLILQHDVEKRHVSFHPGLVALARDCGAQLRACAPYRARTKGKVESGVKYVKRNALAGRSFASFAELEQHLSSWMERADGRVHGTTNEVPRERFRAEAAALLPLPSSSLRVRGERRLRRRVSNDGFVDVDTVRYSVPVEHVARNAEVAIVEDEVVVIVDGKVVATHQRTTEPHSVVEDVGHRRGLYRPAPSSEPAPSTAPVSPSLSSFDRPLTVYAEVLELDALPRPSGLCSADSSTGPGRPIAELRGKCEALAVGGAP